MLQHLRRQRSASHDSPGDMEKPAGTLIPDKAISVTRKTNWPYADE